MSSQSLLTHLRQASQQYLNPSTWFEGLNLQLNFGDTFGSLTDGVEDGASSSADPSISSNTLDSSSSPENAPSTRHVTLADTFFPFMTSKYSAVLILVAFIVNRIQVSDREGEEAGERCKAEIMIKGRVRQRLDLE